MSKPEPLRPIPLDAITIGDQQLRADPEDEGVIELASDIAQRGLLQPIGVYAIDATHFQLLWGSRRLAAHRRLRSPTILARIIDKPADGVRVTAIVENLHRANLTLTEECDAVRHLHHRERKSPDQIAAQLSKSRQWVLRRLSVDSFHNDVREPVLEGRLALGAAEIITQIQDDGSRAYVLSEALTGRYSISQIRALAETLAQSPEITEAVQAGLDTFQRLQENPVITLECHSCHRRRPMPELVLIRVCSDGCAPDTAETTPTNHDTTH